MQRQADALVASLRDFIAQPDFPTLVLNADDASIVMPNRTLAALDRQDDDAYYLLFPEPCANAGSYMSALASTLTKQLEVLNTELAARQLALIAELPLVVNDARYPPVQRLRAAIDHCGQNLPGSAPIVWGLLPGELGDADGYRGMIWPLLAPERVEPWMERHRFLVRDQAPQPFLVGELLASKNDRVLVMEVDFGNARYVQNLVDAVPDKSLPADERLNALFQLAAVDFALKRFPQALEKYGVCFNYFQERGNKAMQALCLFGAANTTTQAGKPLDALKFYQQGLAVGVEEQNLPVIQQGLFGAGSACLELSRNEEAHGYFRKADEVAAKLHNPFAKCDAMEKRGLAEWRLGRIEEAVKTWMQAKELAKQFSYLDRARSILDFLIALSRDAGLAHRVTEFERERSGLAVGAA